MWDFSGIVHRMPPGCGVVASAILCFVFLDSSASAEDEESLLPQPSASVTLCQKLKKALAPFAQPTLILLVIAGSVRNGGRGNCNLGINIMP